eukprot:5880660-Pyramimonas_sp.AAC.1
MVLYVGGLWEAVGISLETFSVASWIRFCLPWGPIGGFLVASCGLLWAVWRPPGSDGGPLNFSSCSPTGASLGPLLGP